MNYRIIEGSGTFHAVSGNRTLCGINTNGKKLYTGIEGKARFCKLCLKLEARKAKTK